MRAVAARWRRSKVAWLQQCSVGRKRDIQHGGGVQGEGGGGGGWRRTAGKSQEDEPTHARYKYAKRGGANTPHPGRPDSGDPKFASVASVLDAWRPHVRAVGACAHAHVVPLSWHPLGAPPRLCSAKGTRCLLSLTCQDTQTEIWRTRRGHARPCRLMSSGRFRGLLVRRGAGRTGMQRHACLARVGRYMGPRSAHTW